jgi:hypothetical protein
MSAEHAPVVALDYEYDVFISYRRSDPTLGWVKQHFLPLLTEWLPNCLPIHHHAKIYGDWRLETGVEWPLALRHSLARSRCLLPILSPEYFRSRWCQAELKTMMERERVLGMRTAANPSGIIFPIRFFDGEHFPAGINNIQQFDLREWSYAGSTEAFRHTQAFLDFTQAVQHVCEQLAQMVLSAPKWRADWPTVWPVEVTDARPQLQLPRIS